MKYSIVFPGQGSQSLGMLSDLNSNFPVISEIFQEASDSISVDLWKILNEDQEVLNLTENTQPIMLAAGYATYKVLAQEANLSPISMAGHSLGEYTALVASNSMNFFDAIQLVRKRGELMQAAVPTGTGSMAAILGLQQRLLSRFRITTNGGQCISCGNCSTYCEMGIDVRAYAQRGENIVRSSCVGCGVCSAVCPRGVLKLENGPLENRINSENYPLGNTLK